MLRPLHVVLATIGSDGDVFPYLAVGSRLVARGHRVTLTTAAHYEPLAKQRGLDFQALVSKAELLEWLGHPDCWHPLKCATVGARWGTRYIARQFEILADLAQGDNVVFAASPAVFAARFLQEQNSIPLATIILQPWLVQSSIEPPLLPGISLPREMPRFVGEAYWRFVDACGDWLVGREVNRVRRDLKLPPVRRIFRWWLSPQRIIGLFPDWYGPPQSDWPPQLRLTGFPVDDGRRDEELSSNVRDFCEDGTPPIAVTFGTEMQVAAELIRESLSACERLGRRCLIVTRYAHQLPADIPRSALHLPYAPFRRLFPLCGAVIHHGGIGTTARILSAGVPQLILPFAFDQPDNGARVTRLGAGAMLRGSKTAKSIARALEPLLQGSPRPGLSEFANRGGKDPLDQTAELIEDLALTPAQ